MTFHGGKLRVLYYDLREDVSQIFGPVHRRAADPDGPTPRIRHTMDVFVAQAPPGAAPVFTTARVSEYACGFLPGRRSSSACSSTRRTCRCSGRARAVHGGLHRPRAGSAVRAERRTARGRSTPAPAAAPCRTPCGRTTATCGRRPTATGPTTRRSRRRRSGTQSRFDPDAAGAGLRPRPGRDAQPEHLHGAGHRRAVRLGPGQQQAVQRLSARLRRRRRERLAAAARLPAARSRTSRSAVRRRSCSSARR